MEFEHIKVETIGRIQYITIDREKKLNALNRFTLAELHDAFTAAFKDPAVGGIILTGKGTKAFVAGADIVEFDGLGYEGGKEIALRGQSTVFDIIANGKKPVIAAVNGFALGGGLELAMACHIRIASENAKMGLPEVTLGLIPGYGGTQRLTQLVGRGKALEMILTADMISAAEALQLGLVNHVVFADDLIPKAEEIINKILTRSPMAVAAAIRAVNAGLVDPGNGYNTEIEEFGKCFGTPDFIEGVSAFMEKRQPNFSTQRD
ncbi:enoyl-CoA hydratase/isomerase family protein [Mucilaginibacter sp. 21P]|uniref:enoyl-CoA hydratase/isomerase family protein n=1 Tax=Mucilaginibacter sp. 21P TaxID=2778902 RepID=UPI001C574C8C|nr:enoyl-CoA hydratase-related protein [Mucilaginibacter sp. 21P]QXV66028.1 enoyl-CoA hydratase/isomerase family protein [Mucilaginibacter sp. 21P]